MVLDGNVRGTICGHSQLVRLFPLSKITYIFACCCLTACCWEQQCIFLDYASRPDPANKGSSTLARALLLVYEHE